MNRKMIGRIAMTSLMLGVSTVACTTGGTHTAAVSETAPKATQMAAKQAAHAREALTKNKASAAVDAAENAVALAPQDASYRMLLGQAYLAAGRFASAETSFKDSLALNPDQSKAKFDLALAQIAQGQGQQAQAMLRSLDGVVPGTDLGLALTLAGDHEAGIHMLVDVVRQAHSTARTRQNLALAYGLDGRWREARAVAMQDTPPDRINDQIAGWAALAGPSAGPQQVAAMLGVKAVKDAGLPTRLALVAPVAGSAPTALASADPAPVSVTVPVAAPEAVAAPVVVAQQDAPGSVTVPIDDAAPVVAAPVAAPEMLSAAPVAAPAPPAMLAAAPVEATSRTPRLLRAPKSPIRTAIAKASESHQGNFVVQLGAFARAGAVETAWNQVSRQSPRLAGYAPSHAQYRLASATLSRLSITGFQTRVDANKLCGAIKARGGQCFVRATAGDAPLEWVRREDAVQVASR